jgi:hypothetical protein
MTSQPDSPVTDRIGIDEDAMDAAQDPDLVIVTGEVVEEDADPDATETDTDRGNDLAAGDLTAGDLTGSDLTESDLTESDGDEYAATDSPELVGAETASTTAMTGTPPDAYMSDGLQSEADGSDNGRVEDSMRPADLGQQWHDIQAMFVDDPRGSVDLAAAAADAAVSALVQTLQQRQSALAPAGGTSADPGGTEQLREALRSYRIFCQSLAEIGQRLAQPAAMTQ